MFKILIEKEPLQINVIDNTKTKEKGHRSPEVKIKRQSKILKDMQSEHPKNIKKEQKQST